MANVENRRLLRAILADRYEVADSFDVLDVEDPEGPFDLCIVDGLMLDRAWKRLAHLRFEYEPLLLPVLALVDRTDARISTRELWTIADDVLLRPVDRIELAARVQSLLRLREMSLRLRRVSDRLEHERRIAHRLQEAALPSLLPDLPGITFHAVYRAGASDVNVGGDWYDALRLPDGRIVMSIGDVAGSGLEAAITMANVRQVLRGIAHVRSDPAMMLDAADRALAGSEPERIVTAFVAVLDLVECELRFASAGHPWPFLRRSNGEVEQLVNRGTPLGLSSKYSRDTELVQLGPGDMLVFYTDGLTEADRDAIASEARLATLIAGDSLLGRDDIAQAVHESMISGDVHDDVAVMTLLIGGARDDLKIDRRPLDSHDYHAVRDARVAFTHSLREHGFGDHALAAAETIFAELVGNVVRYAPGPFSVALDCNGASPVLHVLDRGRGFRHSPRLPSNVLVEAGRGLYIVAMLAEEFSVERRTGGGSHARAVLTPSILETSRLDPAFAFADFDSIARIAVG